MEGFHLSKYIYLESAPQEVFNDRLHDGQSWLQQKLHILIFLEKTSETAISEEAKMEKARRKVFLSVHLIIYLLVCVANLDPRNNFW